VLPWCLLQVSRVEILRARAIEEHRALRRAEGQVLLSRELYSGLRLCVGRATSRQYTWKWLTHHLDS
jgi:hypothetical protein